MNNGIQTTPNSLRRRFFLLIILAAVFCPVSLVRAQTTSFTYQGRLTDAGAAANATYDMQFKLFDSPTVGAGSQIGSTINNGTVLVNNGVFTVQLDFSAAAFSGADRYLEIGVRLADGNGAYTLLSPRQQLTSAVYAIRAGSSTNADTATNASTATNATQLGGVAANQYVQTSDARLSDARVPTAGSNNYIQNTDNSQQVANFNITGNGVAAGTLTATLVNTNTVYLIDGQPVLGIGKAVDQNTFTGVGAGKAYNSSAGPGVNGINNSFFGFQSGVGNTHGTANSFFGAGSGLSNTAGSYNSFFGVAAGLSNESGNSNLFVGQSAGRKNTKGSNNVFFGSSAGFTNETGSLLTVIGNQADVGSPNLTNATAIGAHSTVSKSNSLVLGALKNPIQGVDDTNVGIGTTAPNARFHIAANGGNIVMGDPGCFSGFAGIGFASSLSNCGNYSLLGNGTDTILNRPTGGALSFRENNVPQMSITPGGAVTINTLGAAGSTQLCRNASNQISTCSSSLRYKTNIQPFIGGLSVLNRLRPITFNWKQGGMHDLGFGAEDIAAIEPLLVTRNDKGEVEGVKYDRITAVLVNAVKEQQEQIKQQQSQIQSLKMLVCQRNRRAAVCK